MVQSEDSFSLWQCDLRHFFLDTLTDLDGFYVKIVGAEDSLDDILLLWGGPYGDICFTYKRKLQPAQMRRSLSFTCVVMSTRHLHYDFKCYN